MNRRLLLTGASGRLGGVLLPRLRAAGFDVLGLVRNPGASGDERQSTVQWDLCQPTPPRGAALELAEVTDLVHAAAVVEEPPAVSQAARELIAANVTGTIHLLRHMPALRRVVFVSSVAVYGPPRCCPCTEDHPLAPTRLYGVSKVLTENLLRLCAGRAATGLAVLRVSSIYGFTDPVRAEGAAATFLRRSREGLPLSLVRTAALKRDYIHCDDVATAVTAAVESGVNGTFNVASGTGCSLLDLAHRAAEVVGSQPRIEIDPAIDPDADFVTDVVYDVSRAHAAFGFRPAVTLTQGLTRLDRVLQHARPVLM